MTLRRSAAGAGVLLYTDGLTEARHDGMLFGLDAVSAALAGLHTPSPTDAVAVLRACVAEFVYGALTDDLCLLAAPSCLAEDHRTLRDGQADTDPRR